MVREKRKVTEFTKEELERMTVVQLKRVADYKGVELTYRMKKEEIVEKILEKDTVQLSDEEEQSMSVRVKRIKEQNK